MKSAQDWLSEYAESHQHPLNIKIHWVCVPLIMLSLISLLSMVPLNISYLNNYPQLNNCGFLLILLASVYYFILSKPLFIGMIPVSIILIFGVEFLDVFFISKFYLSLIIFVIAWFGQFYGHKIEGKKPSFFKDIQFLLIGPLWLLSKIYRQYDISY